MVPTAFIFLVSCPFIRKEFFVMLSDKEIKSTIDCELSVLHDCVNSLIKYFVETVNDEDSSRKKIISGMFDFQNNCIVLCGNSLERMYLDGYKNGYEAALLETSGLRNIVDRNVKNVKKRKKH